MSFADAEVTKHSARLNKPVPVGGIMEISTTWLRDWHRHSHQVKVPLKYGVSEFYEPGVQHLMHLRNAAMPFYLAPGLKWNCAPRPHCIELSYAAHSWLTRCCEFAVECAEWYASKKLEIYTCNVCLKYSGMK